MTLPQKMPERESTVVEVLSHIQDSDVVFLNWADGGEILVKDETFLDHIIKTGQSGSARISHIPVSNKAEADVIAVACEVIEAGDFHLGAEFKFFELLKAARS